MARVLSISSVQLLLQKSNPPTLVVLVKGKVGTPGWKNIALERLEAVLSDDGILDLAMVGTPPAGIVVQVVTDVSADLVIDSDLDRLIGVAVHARDGVVTQLLENGGEPTLSGAALPGRLTTLALGEEGQGLKVPWEKLPLEKHPGWPGEKFPLGEKTPLGEKLPLETQAIGGGESSPLGLEKNPLSDVSVGGRSFPGEDVSLEDMLIRMSPFQNFRRG